VFIVIITFPTQMIPKLSFKPTFAPPLAIELRLLVNFLPLVELLFLVVGQHFNSLDQTSIQL